MGENYMQKIDNFVHSKVSDFSSKHVNDHPGYEYFRSALTPSRENPRCSIASYKIPPLKSAYPYHYHTFDEEAFYIISGHGIIKTPKGEKTVGAGDFLFFPANETGAHKITNTSESEMLVYIDFASYHEIDAAVYPDSGKVGVWGGGINKVFRITDAVDYYDGE